MQLPEIKSGAKRNSHGNYATDLTIAPYQSLNLKLKHSEEVSASQLNPL